MKSILYVGATLMIGASIYGFVDYKKTSHSKEFTGMYDPKPTTAPVVVSDNPLPVIEEKTEPAKAAKKAIAKQQPAKEETPVSKSKIEITAADKLESEPVIKETPALAESKSAEQYKKAKKRKLSTKLFSRAPLREDIEEAALPVPSKVKTKKTETKEQ